MIHKYWPLTHTEQVVSPSLKQRLSHCWLSILNLYPHRRLPLPVYAGVFQRSNFSFNPQICIFLSSRISQLPKLKPFSFSVRAMPALPSGGSRIFRQGRPGCRSIFLLFLLLLHRGRGAATPAGTPRGDPGDTLGVSLPTVPHKRRVRPKHPRSQRAAAKLHLVSTYQETEQQNAKHKEAARVCAHTRSPPTFQASRVQQAHGSFFSSSGDDTETCFAGTVEFALPAFSGQQGSASAPQP